MFKKIISFIILTLFCISCGESPTGGGYYSSDTIFLNVYSTAEQDNNGYYHYEYLGYYYGSVYFITEPYTLVHWDSPDEFCVDHFGNEICDPIINYSTYARDDGTGQQNFYMNETFIGDTLTIIGYVSSDTYDIIKLIIIDGR